MINKLRHKAITESIPKIHDDPIPIIRAKPSTREYDRSIEGVERSKPHTGMTEREIFLRDDIRDRNTWLSTENVIEIDLLKKILKQVEEINKKL
jgi:hypothetical protein